MSAKLSEMQTSALLEAGNIGSGHAAIAMSQLMGKKIMIVVPSIEILGIDGLARQFRDKSDMVQILFAIYGGITGAIVFVLEHEMARMLCSIVTGTKLVSGDALGEMEISAIAEVGSIVSSSYLNAVSEMTGLSLLVSTPQSITGSLEGIEAILRKKEAELKLGKEVICIRTEFTQMESRIDGYLVFIPANGGMEILMTKLGV